MKKVMIAFGYDSTLTLEQARTDKSKYVGFQEITCHIIFHVKMDLTRKTIFVASGCLTEPPASITYARVVSLDSVRLVFLLAALNDLDIVACDVGNAYLNARPCREKIGFVARPEFGSRQGTLINIVRALYGLKSSGAAFFAMFNASILEMGFVPTVSDRDVYSELTEELPPKMPEPLGHPVNIYTFVDANHAGNVVTQRSHTGILRFIQNSPMLWLSCHQNTVEMSTFGSEFVALRTARDLIITIRYKLRMFVGVPLEGPAQVFCDNEGVVKNSSVPESVLTKKHNAINYHAVQEAAAAGILEVIKEDTQTNLADLFTKVLDVASCLGQSYIIY